MKTLFLFALLGLMVGCTGKSNEPTSANDRLELVPEPDKDLREAYEKELQEQQETAQDTTYGVPEHKILKPIIQHYDGINMIKVWSSIETRALNESTEGGKANYYKEGETLSKIHAWHLGESGKLEQKFYVLAGQLSFVLEKDFEYNRPIYWDSTLMVESGDTAVFDSDKAKVYEKRSYFKDGALIWQSDDRDRDEPFTAKRLRREQKRLNDDFQKLKAKL